MASAALAKVQEFLDRVPHTMEPDGPGLIPLLTVLAHCHPILALVDVPSEHPEGDVTVLIKHEMTEARQLDQFTFVNSSFTTRARQWLHGFILTSSSIITVPAHKGLSCDSYHLRVTAPDGFLVVAQEVVERDPRAVRSGWRDRARASAVWAVPQDPDPSSSPYVRPANIQFQPYAHLYARRLREKSVRIPRTSKHTHVRDPYFVVMIGERLPGSLGRALAAAFTAFATIWVIGVHGVGDDVAKQTDLVALVLAAPAFTATWIGLSSRRERSFTSLAGRLSTLLSIALSLTAVLAYLSDPDPNRDHHEPLPAFAWVDHWQWHLLAVASLLNVGWMLSCLWVRSRRNRLVRQHEPSRSQVGLEVVPQ